MQGSATTLLHPAATLQSWPEWVVSIPERFNGDFGIRLFNEYADIPIYCSVIYILIVFVLPEQVMKNCAPLNIRRTVIVWNLLLTVFSVLGSLAWVPRLYSLLRERGLYRTTCYFDHGLIHDGRDAFWLFMFLVSKIPEMLDTLFLVLQKKPVIFLHWYHHLTVMLFCWHAGQTLIPSGLWFATMNYCVHSIMYFYYFVCALGMRKVIRPIAPVITSLQLLQMVVGTAIVCYTAYMEYLGEGCGVNRTSIRMGLVMYASYFVLFFILFCNLYLNGKSSSRNPKRAATAEKRNGKAMLSEE